MPSPSYTEDQLVDTIFDITDNGLSLSKSAQKHGIPKQTLSDRMRGKGSKEEYSRDQRLSENEEKRLVDWILRQESLGYAPSHSQIRAYVVSILSRNGEDLEAHPLGVNWVARFVNRTESISNKMGRRQEAVRFNNFTPKAVKWYFDIREKEYGWIKPQNTVNVDKGGIMAGFGLDSLVVGSSDMKQKALLKGAQTRAWTSFIEAVTADGRALKPGIIFKGKDLQKQWFVEQFRTIADWYYITSPNGWIDHHIAIEWLNQVYLPQTKPADEGEARLIILDGHGSHAQILRS
ncbi:DDE superfamily endonuclease domain-containing protein [Apiospora phragmitis]|uniref:DDE superfamily endonuclease domain-containing protein n=1 Tax=Apiospora phragmitis TaxID=2905665 RepID=A0ABR1VQ22_9PEZI